MPEIAKDEAFCMCQLLLEALQVILPEMGVQQNMQDLEQTMNIFLSYEMQNIDKLGQLQPHHLTLQRFSKLRAARKALAGRRLEPSPHLIPKAALDAPF